MDFSYVDTFVRWIVAVNTTNNREEAKMSEMDVSKLGQVKPKLSAGFDSTRGK